MEEVQTQSALAPANLPARILAMAKNRHPELQSAFAYLLLLIQPLIFFRSVLITRRRHIPFDIEGWHLPIAAFLARCARQHVWPSWNPFDGCGAPVFIDPQAQMFYPVTWLALLAGNLSDGQKLFYWLQALVPLHMAMGGVFLYLFLRRLDLAIPAALLGATIYELGAFFASQAEHLAAVCSAAYFPLLLLCVVELARCASRRWISLTALASALLILAGFPQSAFVALVSAVLFAGALIIAGMSRWRAFAAFLAGIALGVLVCTVQLVPTLQAIPLTIAKLRGDWHLGGGGLPLQALASFVWPDYYHVFKWGTPRFTSPFEFTWLYTYCGHAAVALLVLTPFVLWLRRDRREVRLLLICLLFAILSALWMLGDQTPVYRTFYSLLPRTFRGSLYSEYALMAFTLWTGVTAALTLHFLRMRRGAAISWSVAVLTAINLIAVSSNRPFNSTGGSYKAANSERTIAGDPYLVDTMQWLTRSAAHTAEPPLRFDLFGPDFSGLGSGAKMYRIPAAVADDPFNLLRFYQFRLSLTGDPFWDRIQPLSGSRSRWIDAMNVGFLLATPQMKVRPDARFIPIPVRGLQAWRNQSALPRFYLVNQVKSASNATEALALLPGISDPQKTAIVEGLPANWHGGGENDREQTGSVQVVSYEDSRVELLVHTAQSAYLVTSEAFYPGWHATANGRPVSLLPTNLAFRGMPVGAGLTRITMWFHVDHLELSVTISVAALLACVLLLAFPRPLRRLTADTQP